MSLAVGYNLAHVSQVVLLKFSADKLASWKAHLVVFFRIFAWILLEDLYNLAARSSACQNLLLLSQRPTRVQWFRQTSRPSASLRPLTQGFAATLSIQMPTC
jgi:hypothetical protein